MAVTGARWCDFVVWIGDSLSIQRVDFDEHFWVVSKILHTVVNFYSARMRPYLLHMRSTKQGDFSQAGMAFATMETIYQADFCQSRIAGRNGSSACTLIASGFVKQCLLNPELLDGATSRKDTLVKAMLEGNQLYDSMKLTGLLSVDEVLDMMQLELDGEVFFSCNDVSSVQIMLVAAATGDEERNISGGVCVLAPYSVALLFYAGNVYVVDSHSHNLQGALVAVVPVQHFDAYFSTF